MKFCTTCGGRLERIIETAEMQWRCTVCHKPYPLTAEDTLVYEVSYGASAEGISMRLMENSTHDPAAMTVYRKCESCGSETMIGVRSPKDEKMYYLCRCKYT